MGTGSDGVSEMDEWIQMLKALPPGFDLRLHDWRKEYPAPRANVDDTREFFGSYTPGEHWLHLVRVVGGSETGQQQGGGEQRQRR